MKDIKAREVLDSRGNPTVECDVILDDGGHTNYQQIITANSCVPNIKDGCVCHTDDGMPLTIGDNVTVGHMVILHSCLIGDNSLVGMGSTVLNNAKIGNNCLVGANSLITEGKEFPDNSMIMGSPGKVVRELTEMEVNLIKLSALHYVENMKRFKKDLIQQT